MYENYYVEEIFMDFIVETFVLCPYFRKSTVRGFMVHGHTTVEKVMYSIDSTRLMQIRVFFRIMIGELGACSLGENEFLGFKMLHKI
jgi:hypothetical protein